MKKYLIQAWGWLKKNAALIVIAALVSLYVYGLFQKANISQDNFNQDFHCQTLCFPQQHELIENGNENTCWCYDSVNTLKKIDK